MSRVNRLSLAKALAKKTGLSQEDATAAVGALIDEIKAQYQKGNSIELRGFGTFYPAYKKGRSYTIARLYNKIEAKGRTTLKFKPSKQILIYDKE